MRIFQLLRRGLLLIPAVFLGTASAQTFQGFSYTTDGTSVTITGYSGGPTSLVIPAEIAGLPVKTITGLGSNSPIIPPRSTVKSITIPDGVATISGSSLKNFRLLTSITLPDSVTTLEASAFSGCSSLTSVVLSDGLTVLDSTFSGCAALTSVTLPSGVTTLNSTFMECTSLSSVVLPPSVTTLTSTFQGCTSLANIVVPDSATMLSETFAYCTSLTTVSLPAGLTQTGARTFEGCTALLDIDFLPEGLLSIGGGAFRNCTGLTRLAFPASLVTIGASAFSGCTGLTELAFPTTLATIEAGAFANCRGLTELAFPATLATIGASAFDNCTGLTELAFPTHLATIGNFAFRNCTGLTGLILPTTLATIGISAFENCIGLTSLMIPESVTQIGDGAFWGCQILTDVSVPDRFLASLANIGLDFNAQVASDALITGIANNLANNPSFVTKLANEIISKTGHYGLSTQNDITALAGMTPQTVRTVLAEIAAEQPPANAITSDVTSLSIRKGKPVQYAVTTNFNATAFSAVGLPPGMAIHPTTGVITGKSSEVGTYSVFLYAGVPGGSVVSSAKIFVVTPLFR